MSTTGRLTFSTPHGVIDRIHRDPSYLWPPALPPGPSGFADAEVFMIDVAYLTDGRPAFDEDLANLPGGKADLGITLLLGHQLSVGACGTDQLTATPQLDLNIMDEGTKGDVFQRYRIARLDVSPVAAYDHVPHFHLRRGDNISFLAVPVVQQGNPGATIGIVLYRGHPGRHIRLVTSEIDQPVSSLVSASDVTACHSSVTIPAARPLQGSHQTLLGFGGGDFLEV